jgi:succinyl-CoA:acetate CoA-transferase
MRSGRTTRGEPDRIAARTPPAIVSMVWRVDHAAHDVDALATVHRWADLCGWCPKRRARGIIEHCAYPDFRPGLLAHLGGAARASCGQHAPQLINEALFWYAGCVAGQTMRL